MDGQPRRVASRGRVPALRRPRLFPCASSKRLFALFAACAVSFVLSSLQEHGPLRDCLISSGPLSFECSPCSDSAFRHSPRYVRLWHGKYSGLRAVTISVT
ncbi:hypothetical protein BD309DRAFT_465077 [Dichomitus squalens]|nr:hypothetical protein BD309DRAFT_465077 [Dichomitus squalens]